ncbi:MAG: cupin domain-containing protein [Anaerolineae bacterium]|nr:cupin domain-containing protein [Anaerolineae bacterium]
MGVVHKRVKDSADWRWEDVNVEGYNTNNATKQVLISEKDGAPNFAMRCFTVPAREFSSLDKHERDHGVMVMQGRARVQLGETYTEVGVGDVVYIPGWEVHQFENLTDEPFVFLCIVPPMPKKQA